MTNEMLLKTARTLLAEGWLLQPVGSLAPVITFVQSAIDGYAPDIDEGEEEALRSLIQKKLNEYRQEKTPVEVKQMFDLIARFHLAVCIYEGVTEDILHDAIHHYFNQRMNGYARYVEMITTGDMTT